MKTGLLEEIYGLHSHKQQILNIKMYTRDQNSEEKMDQTATIKKEIIWQHLRSNDEHRIWHK